MDRNSEQFYSYADQIEKPRAKWHREKRHLTSFNAGVLVPFYINSDIIPGTTIKNSTSMVIRLSTPLVPVMDNCYIDTYYFKCSKFWYWEHFRAMLGENELGAWAQTIEYERPKIETTTSVSKNTFLDYAGCPLGIAGLKFDKMVVNAYIDIWNQWFRDQNLQAPIALDKTDSDVTYDGTISTGGTLLPVCKFHDYFTSCLPEPQKANAITTPLGTYAPVKTSTVVQDTSGALPLYVSDQSNNPLATGSLGIYNGGAGSYTAFESGTGTTTAAVIPNNLIADLTSATAATINALRLAFATQRILERDTFGTRYRELLRNHFGSNPADEALLTPEYLGGTRQGLNISTVLNNNGSSTSPLGETGAMSVTTIINDDFTKSFSKDDILIGLLCVRTDNTYQNGLPRQYTRKGRLDQYWPEYAHIGNQPVYNYEIYAQGPAVVDSNGNIIDDQVFGYKEAWAEYKFENNMVSGEMRSGTNSLDIWHYASDNTSLPVLSDPWIISDALINIDRTIAVTSTNSNQFWADILISQDIAAPIPFHCTPGLIDHF